MSAADNLLDAIEAFLAAHAASQEVLSNLTPAQASGPDPWPPQAEYLCDEARHRWDILATGWAEHLLPPEVREVGSEYARPKLAHTPVAMDWDALDWSKGRVA